MSKAAVGFSDDAFLGGRLRLRQPLTGHRAGHDAILLAASVRARPGERVVEFGAGVGTAGLAVASRIGGCALTLVEIDPDLVELARHNAAINRIEARVCRLDVGAPASDFAAAGVAPDSADALLMNPPFNAAMRHRASPDADRRAAHMADADLLGRWLGAARRVLKPRGELTLIWRADGLGDVLAALDHGFGSVAIVPVHGRSGEPAIRILMRAVKGGRAPLRILTALALNDAAGRSTDLARDILSGRGVLPLAEGSGAT